MQGARQWDYAQAGDLWALTIDDDKTPLIYMLQVNDSDWKVFIPADGECDEIPFDDPQGIIKGAFRISHLKGALVRALGCSIRTPA